MDVRSKVAVVTGAAGGIGSALVAALAGRGATVVAADLDERVYDVAQSLGAKAWAGDCTSVDGIAEFLAFTREHAGDVDMYFANAGIVGQPGIGDDEAVWDQILNVNVRAHVRAARALLPGWLERGSGYFVATASAAGLLTQIGQAGYSVTKHAALGFAEWLSITHGDEGIGVTCVCPMGVNTAMLNAGLGDSPDGETAAAAVKTAGRVLEPADVATTVMAAVESDSFLALPHPEVLEMYRMKGQDYDRWLRGMRRYQDKLRAARP